DVGRLSFAGGGAPGGARAGGPGAGPGGPPGAGAPGRGAAPGAAGPGGPGGPGAGAPRAGGPVAAGGPGAPGAAGRGGGGFGGFGGGAAQPPVTLSRNGRDHTIASGGSNVRAGTEIKLTTERPSLSLRLTELDKGSWVIFELPGFTTAAAGTAVDSLDALRKASDTAYYK